MTRRNRAIEQAEYCQNMLKRIVADLKVQPDPCYEETYCLHKHTVIENDIVHLRRELMKISKIVRGEE